MSWLLGALGFLTVLKVRGAAPGQSVAFFPLVGAALGWLGARWLSIADPFFGASLGALLVLAFWCFLTGMRQENGVISTAGIAALIFLLLIRWQALTRLPAGPVFELTACLALSRGAMAAIAYTTRPRDGLSDDWNAPRVLVALATAAAFAFLAGPLLALVLLAATVFAAALLRQWFSTRLDGVDAAGLHAASFAIETWLIVLAGCRNCPWWS